ncbi:tripartite tricarboxylate transporter TctB family protein [Tritonibacter horizontis]|uniref:Tripartite tricarboxylate transporter TctB family protein n=1 Tax=Tritonibacter horizontis TaxID=1768241 RepID=A0A132C1M5_9RHOB|nr:tripartite tricarboxylate transporter TctB family protein [Tritonibacter horizontis]KUP94518.1 tripartite tricarboxylate transporter TctB family protein [Tritonibacter horizontis]
MIHHHHASSEPDALQDQAERSGGRFRSPETLTMLFLLVASVLSLVFLGALVAEPKALFGRALSAIPPSLFPAIVLTALTLLSALALFLNLRGIAPEEDAPMSVQQWARAAALFGIMLIYALILVEFGFLISTVIAVALISVLMGATSLPQIAVVSVSGPVLLYLAATRLLAVSLPELDLIEAIYANIPGL